MLDELRKFFEEYKSNSKNNIPTREDFSMAMHRELYERMAAKTKDGKSYVDRVTDYLIQQKTMKIESAERSIWGFLINMAAAATGDNFTGMSGVSWGKLDSYLNEKSKENIAAALQVNSQELLGLLKETTGIIKDQHFASLQHPDGGMNFAHASALLYAENRRDELLDKTTRQQIAFEETKYIIDGQIAERTSSTKTAEDIKALNQAFETEIQQCHEVLNGIQAKQGEQLEEVLEFLGNQKIKTEGMETQIQGLAVSNKESAENIKLVKQFLEQQQQTQQKLVQFKYNQAEIEGLRKGFQFFSVLGSLTKSPEIAKLGEVGQGITHVLDSVNNLKTAGPGPLALAGGYAGIGIAVLSLVSSFFDQGPSIEQATLEYLQSLGEYIEKEFKEVHKELKAIHKDMVNLFEHTDQLIRTSTEIISHQIDGLSKFIAHQFSDVHDSLKGLHEKLQNLQLTSQVAWKEIYQMQQRTISYIIRITQLMHTEHGILYLGEFETLKTRIKDYVLGRLPSITQSEVEKLMSSAATTWGHEKSGNPLLTGKILFDRRGSKAPRFEWDLLVLPLEVGGLLVYFALFLDQEQPGFLGKQNVTWNTLVNPDIFLAASDLYLGILEKSPAYESAPGIKRIDDLIVILDENAKFIQLLGMPDTLNIIYRLYQSGFDEIMRVTKQLTNSMLIKDKDDSVICHLSDIKLKTMVPFLTLSDHEVVNVLGKQPVYYFDYHDETEKNKLRTSQPDTATIDDFIFHNWVAIQLTFTDGVQDAYPQGKKLSEFPQHDGKLITITERYERIIQPRQLPDSCYPFTKAFEAIKKLPIKGCCLLPMCIKQQLEIRIDLLFSKITPIVLLNEAEFSSLK